MNRRSFFKRIAQAVAVLPVALPIIEKVSARPWRPFLKASQLRIMDCGNISRATIEPLSEAQQRAFVNSFFYGKPLDVPAGPRMDKLELIYAKPDPYGLYDQMLHGTFDSRS